jgi:hypothetical protein
MKTEKSLLTDRLIPVEQDGTTIWMTQDQYDELMSENKEMSCTGINCKLREKKFHVPDFIRGKTLLNEQTA